LQDQAALTQAIRDYFTNDRLEPKGAPMTDEAWRFQGHLILHLLNDDVIAVSRSELLGSLVRGTTCTFDKESMQWIFKVGTHAAAHTPQFSLSVLRVADGIRTGENESTDSIAVASHIEQYISGVAEVLSARSLPGTLRSSSTFAGTPGSTSDAVDVRNASTSTFL
jgi:hypothetical protein